MKTFSISLFVVIFISAIETFEFNRKAVNIIPIYSEKELTLLFDISQGFGVQKKASHKIVVYALRKGHQKEVNLKKKITLFGKPIKWIKNLKGETASEDKAYFSSVDPFIIKMNNSKNQTYAIFAKIFFCSFADKFCSVQTIRETTN